MSGSAQSEQIRSEPKYDSIFHWLSYLFTVIVILAMMAIVIPLVNHNIFPKQKELCNFPSEWKNNFVGSVKIAIIVTGFIAIYVKNLSCSW